MLRVNGQRGDTIIEVLFAITIFSLVAVGGLALMNQGTAIAQRSLEVSLVREQIDAQTDGLRYLRDAYIADGGHGGSATDIWKKVVVDHKADTAQPFDDVSNGVKCVLPSPDQSFTLDVAKLQSNPLLVPTLNTATYSQVRYDTASPEAQGIWVQAVAGHVKSSGQPNFYDFHIRACWLTPGQSAPVTLGTIVRLYVP